MTSYLWVSAAYSRMERSVVVFVGKWQHYLTCIPQTLNWNSVKKHYYDFKKSPHEINNENIDILAEILFEHM